MPSHRSITVGLVVSVALALLAAGDAGGDPVRRPPASSDPRAATSDDSAEVASTVARFHEAIGRADSASALALLAPGAVILESGAIESLAEYRAHHLGADIEFARAVDGRRGPVTATVRGDAAWAVSTSSAQGTFKGRAVSSTGAELMVLTRTSAGWRIAAIHWSSRRRS